MKSSFKSQQNVFGYTHSDPIALVGMPCLAGQNCSILHSVLDKIIGFFSSPTAYIAPLNTLTANQQQEIFYVSWRSISLCPETKICVALQFTI